MASYKAAVVQAASVPFDPMASAEKAARLVREAAAAGARAEEATPGRRQRR